MKLLLGSGVALVVIASLETNAFAQARSDNQLSSDRSGVLTPEHKGYESPQNFMIELRFGPYRPDIDSDPNLHGTPYLDTFGTPQHFYLGVEFEWEAVRIEHFGTIGPDVGIGTVSISRLAKLQNPGPSGQIYSAENTTLTLYPMYVAAVARFDYFLRHPRIKVPFVPYVKVGLAVTPWEASTDTGTSVGANGVVGKGYTLGLYSAFGVSFDLNVLDERAAREFDNSMGVNHTYLFGEFYSNNPTLIPQSNALRVGTSAFACGVAFEF